MEKDHRKNTNFSLSYIQLNLMKRFITLLLVLILVSCNNHKKTGTTIVTKDSAVQPSDTDNNEQFLESLRNMSPLNDDQLKALIPATVMGATVRDPNVTTSMGAGMATGEYVISDSSKVVINIYDCAGDGGAGVYNMQYVNMVDMNTETENDFTKSIRIGANKGYEQCQKNSRDCNVTWFTGGRYLVSLESENIGADELIKEAKKLVIK
jgi:hypothetical protein